MFKLTVAELNHAKLALDHHGYSTMLPTPFEWEDLAAHWSHVRERLCLLDLDDYRPFDPLVITAAKSAGGTRPLHMLHPQDMLLYTSLTLLLKDHIEASRVPLTEQRAFSYRASDDGNALYQTMNRSHEAYMKRLRHKTMENQFVATTDIADFYPSIPQRALCSLLVDRAKTKRAQHAARLLTSTFSNGLMSHEGRGIPTGPYASRLLAEVLLDDIDRFLLSRRIDFVRWVDDFNMFFPSSTDAKVTIFELSKWLYDKHDLRLQYSKTHILKAADYSSKMLVDLDDLLADRVEIASLFGDVDDYEIADEVSDEEVEELVDDVHAMQLFELLVDSISQRLVRPDYRVIEFAIRKLRGVGLDSQTRSDLLEIILENMEHFVPIVDNVSRLISLLIPPDASERYRVGRELLASINNVAAVDHYAVWILTIFGKDPRWGCVDDLIGLFRSTRSDVVKRYSALAVAKAGRGGLLLSDLDPDCAPLVRLAILKAAGPLPHGSSIVPEAKGALEETLWLT